MEDTVIAANTRSNASSVTPEGLCFTSEHPNGFVKISQKRSLDCHVLAVEFGLTDARTYAKEE